MKVKVTRTLVYIGDKDKIDSTLSLGIQIGTPKNCGKFTIEDMERNEEVYGVDIIEETADLQKKETGTTGAV